MHLKDIVYISIGYLNSPAILSVCLFLAFLGCTLSLNPENSGGKILAIPEGPWCQFSISDDGKWLQYMGVDSPLLKPDARNPSLQRETFLLDLETGDSYFAEPDSIVKNRIATGLGPDGLGYFSPDHTKLFLLYLTGAIIRKESGLRIRSKIIHNNRRHLLYPADKPPVTIIKLT